MLVEDIVFMVYAAFRQVLGYCIQSNLHWKVLYASKMNADRKIAKFLDTFSKFFSVKDLLRPTYW